MTQRPAHRLPGRRAPIPGMTLDVARNVGLADPAEVAGVARTHLTQGEANERQMVDDGSRRQTSFLLQILVNASKICSCGVSGGGTAGAIVPVSPSTDSKHLSAARSSGWMHRFLDRCRRYCSTIHSPGQHLAHVHGTSAPAVRAWRDHGGLRSPIRHRLDRSGTARPLRSAARR
jgi:hypothetical protein